MHENNKKDKPTRLADARDLARRGNCRVTEKNGVYKVYRIVGERPTLIATAHSIAALEKDIERVTSNLNFNMLKVMA